MELYAYNKLLGHIYVLFPFITICTDIVYIECYILSLNTNKIDSLILTAC